MQISKTQKVQLQTQPTNTQAPQIQSVSYHAMPSFMPTKLQVTLATTPHLNKGQNLYSQLLPFQTLKQYQLMDDIKRLRYIPLNSKATQKEYSQASQSTNSQVVIIQHNPPQIPQLQKTVIQVLTPPSKPNLSQGQRQTTQFFDDEPIPEFVKLKNKKEKPYDLENSLQLQIKAKQNIIKLNSKNSQLLPVVVNLKTKELDEDQEGDRSPIDLVCVIDISDSMSGEKIALVRQTLMSLLEVLSERDRLCLVQFDDRAERLTPLLRNSKQNFEVFAQKINGLDSRGGTSIADGMQLAFRVLKDRKYSNPVSSIFLLTDGLDNGADKRVQEHMISLGLLSTNFTIQCFGFGRDHDEDLLNNISNIKDGSFYFIDKLDTVDECFASALGGLMSVVALDVNIYVTNTALKPFENIKIKKTFGKMWVQKGTTSGHMIGLLHLLAGNEKGFLLEMEIPPMNFNIQDKERSQCVLSVYLTAKDKSGVQTVKKEARLTLHFINQNEKIGEIQEDGEVMENYFRVKGAEAIEQAINLANSGKHEEGSKKIDSIMAQISSNKNLNQTKMKPIIQQLVHSSESCRAEIYRSTGKKSMVSNAKCFIEQKSPGVSSLYSNRIQSTMIDSVKSKKTGGSC